MLHCLMSAEANVTVDEETETEEFGLNYCVFQTAKLPQSYNDVSISDALTSELHAEVEALVPGCTDKRTRLSRPNSA